MRGREAQVAGDGELHTGTEGGSVDGRKHRRREVHDLVEQSEPAGDIVQGELVGSAMAELRAFMFERVYLQQEHAHIRATVRRIFEDLIDTHGYVLDEATDYLAGMTDRFALAYE